MSGEAEALAGAAVGEVPGSPGGVRALADSWRSAARTVTWGADLADSARATVSSCRGMSADACREAARGLTRDLEGALDCLLDGAGVLEDYAGGQQAGAGGAGSGASESDNPFKRLWKREFEHIKTVDGKRRLTTEDVNRIKAQDEGGEQTGEPWISRLLETASSWPPSKPIRRARTAGNCCETISV